MSKGLLVEQCPKCGKVYQKNLSNLCGVCIAEENAQIQALEKQLKRNRNLTNEEAAELTSIPVPTLQALIRKGRIRLYDYPNLADVCDLCAAPIRKGKLCTDCSVRIQADINQELRQAKVGKERTFFTKQDR